MDKHKTVKMKFSEDKFYNDMDTPFYVKGIVYDVPMEMKDRWLTRGGIIVDTVGSPLVVEAKQQTVDQAEGTAPIEPVGPIGPAPVDAPSITDSLGTAEDLNDEGLEEGLETVNDEESGDQRQSHVEKKVRRNRRRQ